ncbi:LytTR family DNA-binding domain-containing protein [Acetivibrio cellulolyticus]|uniref:LytTR family DNA-binding domain-containing protein n=1 Tax=Acetivibrio cellulolyticus TaxID=35830 RepID=UPI0038992707
MYFAPGDTDAPTTPTKKGKYKVRDGLDALEGRLAPKSFFRCHRSYLVNLNYISKIMPWIGQNSHVSVIDGFPYEIPISRNKIKDMKDTLGI